MMIKKTSAYIGLMICGICILFLNRVLLNAYFNVESCSLSIVEWIQYIIMGAVYILVLIIYFISALVGKNIVAFMFLFFLICAIYIICELCPEID